MCCWLLSCQLLRGTSFYLIQGVGPTLAINFATYESLKSFWLSHRPDDSTLIISLGCGSLAGVASSTGLLFDVDLLSKPFQLTNFLMLITCSYVPIGSCEKEKASGRSWWKSESVQDRTLRHIQTHIQVRRYQRTVQRITAWILQSGSWRWHHLHGIRELENSLMSSSCPLEEF